MHGNATSGSHGRGRARRRLSVRRVPELSRMPAGSSPPGSPTALMNRFVARRPIVGGTSNSKPTSTVAPPAYAAVPALEVRVGREGVALSEFAELSQLAADPRTTDIFVNGGSVWADIGDGPIVQEALQLTADRARELAVRLIALGGRHIDEATPCVD
ncbi:MAG: putative type II/type pathway secretion protein, partial [Homoserinimonas sp.]|nr:putative type II/type pathway secretion protein [Homoserinimonas sp.]